MFPEFLPQRVRQDPQASAEVRMYDLLGSQMPYGWTVFYDVAWLGLARPNQGPRDGQIDFIVAHPTKGVLLIEVKGGRIRFDGARRQWISTDRFGVDHDIDPFAQVRTSKYALLEKLKSLPALRDKWIELAHSVCFPASARIKHAVTPDAPPEIIIGADDLTSLPACIEQILAYSRQATTSAFEHGKLIVGELTQLLGRSVELPNPLALQTLDEHQEIMRLTESQMRVLSVLKRVRRAAIGGAAGSGKTFLAVEKAKRLAAEGFRTLLTCYTDPLVQMLRLLAKGHHNLDVLTVDELALASKCGAPDTSASLPTMLFEAMTSANPHSYDAIVVDEGQDLTSDWWIALESCLREGKESVFYVFYDTHQALYQGAGTLPDGMTECLLEDNVRNTQSICNSVKRHYRGDVAITARGPAGRGVDQVPYKDEREFTQALNKTISRLLKIERVPNTDIIVLTPRRLDRSSLPRLTLATPLRLVMHMPAPRSSEVQFTSVEQFKGLERSVVIVTELDDELPRNDILRSSTCYVAFSRPRNHLVLMGTSSGLAAATGP